MSNTQRNYLRDFDYRRYAHTASASQISTFLTCPRKWWFSKVIRIPEEMDQTKFIFGDRLHEACERWLLSDDTGRDPDGKPLELWPDGWNKGLDDFDAGLVKQLVEKGIEEGVLRRTPNRAIEKPFQYQVVPGVSVCGYRDVSAPGLVEDHKSIKRRRYKSSKKDLAVDPQLLLYAAIDIRERMEVGYQPDPADKITLRHNQFIKDPNDLFVQPCETQVTVGEVMDFWENDIEPTAGDMLRLKQAKTPAAQYEQVEGPRKKGACREYGGCPFAEVCGGVKAPSQLVAEIDNKNTEPKPETQQEESMGIFDRNKGGKKAAKTKKTREPKPLEETATATAEATEAPPWANDDCPACGGVGFNKESKPCKACNRIAAQNDGAMSSDYDITYENGYAIWSEDGEELGCAKVTSEVAVGDDTKPEAKAEKPKTRKKKTKETEPAEEPRDVEAAAETAEPVDTTPAKNKKAGKTALSTAKKGRGRPKSGFTMVYGSVRRAAMKQLDLNVLFAECAQQLAETEGVDSYYGLDRFKRRDKMASIAGKIAEDIDNATLVIVRPIGPDVTAFAAALEPYAKNIVEGLA